MRKKYDHVSREHMYYVLSYIIYILSRDKRRIYWGSIENNILFFILIFSVEPAVRKKIFQQRDNAGGAARKSRRPRRGSKNSMYTHR